MTDPIAPESAPRAPEPATWGSVGVDRYLEANWARFTPEALADALLAAGHPRAVVDEAVARVTERHVEVPDRDRARTIARLAYGIVYLILVGRLFVPDDVTSSLSGPLAMAVYLAVLTPTTLVAWLFAEWLIGKASRRIAVIVLLAASLIPLAIIGPLCLAQASYIAILPPPMGA